MKIMKLLSVLIFAVMLVLPQSVGASPPMGASPTAGGYTQMTYDSKAGLVILYGGQWNGRWYDPATWCRETWTFDPETNVWVQKFPAVSPDPHSGGDMTYDSRAGVSILSILPDNWILGQPVAPLQTWAYNVQTNSWTKLADGPRPLVGQRIVYDSESDRIIMFGGIDASTFKPVNDTYAYDYNTDTWSKMDPQLQPQFRNYHGMVYDSKADRVVMWGGGGVSIAHVGQDYAEVWTYDYNTDTWERFENKKDGPTPRYYIFLAYDEKADKIITYGGYDYGNDETWSYDLNTQTWQQMHPLTNPGLLSRYGMVYAKNVNRTILFGGQEGPTNWTYLQYKTDTWSYNLKLDRWTNISPGQ
jgi:hypothetical protein